MNNIFKYIFIGFIQGITEFLPISSSGHIVIFGSIFGIQDLMLLSVAAHIGTLFAVIFCYRKKLFSLIKKPICETNFELIIATIPTVIIVVFFHSMLDKAFSVNSIVWGFLASSILLIVADLIKDKNRMVSKSNALFMGLGQGLAVLPGLSRSGTTLCFGLISGINKENALDFSFLMSIPVILGSAIYEIIQMTGSNTDLSFVPILIVMASSFVFGILSIKIMLKLISNNKLYYFSIYLIILSLIVLLMF